MRPNHHQFIAFAYVVREGSFSAAAKRLGVTQSTITQHVAKLEKQVGAPLLLRTRDGITLTPAHVHQAVRSYLGLDGFAQSVGMNLTGVEDIGLFDPSKMTHI